MLSKLLEFFLFGVKGAGNIVLNMSPTADDTFALAAARSFSTDTFLSII